MNIKMDNKSFVSDSEAETKENEPILNNTYYTMDENKKTIVSVLRGWFRKVVQFITKVPY